ncbi:hypothetical protein B0H14DRAFT_2693525 [Mycena olivaceomarginata]|nr:hypothetical protein B0H14DRAFT_2693525 [Mycena olivaceomarginata]
MGSPFATQEDAESLWYEQSNYRATHLASVGFGLHIAVFATVTYYTLQMRSAAKGPPHVGLLACLQFFAVRVGTINLACSVAYNENAWLYRAGVLWNFAWYIVVPPALFFIACIVLSILTVVQLALPTVALPQLSLAVWIVLMLLPIWLTILIAGLRVAFTIISIILLGLFGDKNTAQNLFIPLMVQFECIAPEMIILRVVYGARLDARYDSTKTQSNELRDGTGHPWCFFEMETGKHGEEKKPNSHTDSSLNTV